MYGLFDKISAQHLALELAFMNSVFYIVLCVFLVPVIPYAGPYSWDTFLIYFVVAPFASPFMLAVLPWGKRLIEKI